MDNVGAWYKYVHRGRVIDKPGTEFVRYQDERFYIRSNSVVYKNEDGYLVVYWFSTFRVENRYLYMQNNWIHTEPVPLGAATCFKPAPVRAFVVFESLLPAITVPLTRFLRRDGDNAIMYQVVQFMG